jgi:hypothetical protein
MQGCNGFIFVDVVSGPAELSRDMHTIRRPVERRLMKSGVEICEENMDLQSVTGPC